MFKWLMLVVLGLTGCYSPGEEIDNMSGGMLAKSGGWSTSSKLRNNGVDNMGGAVNFIAGREHNETPAKNYTVQFFVGQPVAIPTSSNAGGNPVQAVINPVAEITWTVEGNPVRRIVSVTNGAAVTGVGQAVKVVVRDKTNQAAVGVSTCQYDVGVTVAPGSRPSENQPAVYNPTLETILGQIIVAPGANAVVPIPANAGVISAYITATVFAVGVVLGPNDALVQQQDSFGDIVRFYDPSPSSFVPIMAQCSQLTLSNQLPPGPGVPNIAFSVTFGIDG